MKLVGLDLSLTCTGWAVWNPAMPTKDLRFGTFKPATGLRDLPRLQWIRGEVWELVQGADLVVIEDFSFGSKGAYDAEKFGLGWMVRDWLQSGGFPYVLVPPASLKKFVAGGEKIGERSKEVIIREVFRRWAISVNDNNAADALVLLHIGRCLAGEMQPAATYQREVVSDVVRRHAHLAALFARLRERAAAPALNLAPAADSV